MPLTLTDAPPTVGGIVVKSGARDSFDLLFYSHDVPHSQGGIGTPAQPATITIALRGASPRSRAIIR